MSEETADGYGRSIRVDFPEHPVTKLISALLGATEVSLGEIPMQERKTSEWKALQEVWEEKKQIILDREVEHAQHVVDHGAPRTRPEVWLAALVLMKANRVWNNMLRGGTSAALYDSALDLGNYADFLAALLKEQREQPMAEAVDKFIDDRSRCAKCNTKFQPGAIAFGDELLFAGAYYCRACHDILSSPKVGLKRPAEPEVCDTCGNRLTADWFIVEGKFYCGAHVPVVHT